MTMLEELKVWLENEKKEAKEYINNLRNDEIFHNALCDFNLGVHSTLADVLNKIQELEAEGKE